jgi:uncharacterized membrane protein YGL010W
MRRVEQHLAKYAAYHQDRRNVVTHFFGIPLIVLGVAVLLSRAILPLGPIYVSVAGLVVAVVSVYYLLLDFRLGLALSVFLWGALAVGQLAAQQSTLFWMLLGVGSFVVGWGLQVLGHVWEGRKPAFLDDIRSLLIGPLFVAAECAFALGLMQALRIKIRHCD